jgi:serine phosphatase RsbU (regulator of sigma subunit)
MSLWNDGKRREFGQVGRGARPSGSGWERLVRDLFEGRYGARQSVELNVIAAEYGLDNKAVLQAFADLQSLGMVSLSGNCSAVVHSPNPKEMQEAYEIRAALEEIAGRTAATALKGNTDNLRNELGAMRRAANEGDLDAYAKHDVKFHKSILQASQNKALLRVWDTLALELRVYAVVGKISKHLQEVVESHQPIIDALENGRGREAGLLLRNHVETFLEYLKKSESDSGFHRALRKDLEGAKDVQQAFFPPQTLSIPCVSCETFYQPARGIGGDYYDFLPLQAGRWGIAIGDVSGKGIGAALIMASLQASLRAQALRPHLDLHTLIADVNRLVFESSPADLFASLFYAEYEPATRILKYVNAGHNPPIVVRPKNGSCEMFHLKSTDMPVGISADRQFAPTTFQLSVDDVLVAYTDGITEAENYRGQLWGEEKLESLLRSCNGATSEQIVECILDEVSAFSKGQPQRDDMTLVVMTVQEGCDL